MKELEIENMFCIEPNEFNYDISYEIPGKIYDKSKLFEISNKLMEKLYNKIFYNQINYIKSLSITERKKINDNLEKILHNIPPTDKDIILYFIKKHNNYKVMTISLSVKSRESDKNNFESYFILEKGSKVLPLIDLEDNINKNFEVIIK